MHGKVAIIMGLLVLIGFGSAVTAPVRFQRGSRPSQPVKPPAGGRLGVDSVKTDPETGLAIDDQLMLVKSHCTACHSSQLILQSHFPREKWVERIRWMQRTQNLWNLGESEPAILAYLTKHYGPTEGAGPPLRFDGRREPLNAVPWHKN